MAPEDAYAVDPAIRLASPRAVGGAKSHADMLHRLQSNSFAYFVHETTSHGLVLDKTATNWPASIAAIGMALTVYPVGVRRRLISRTDAARLCRRPLRFFAASQQGEAPDATGLRGFYYHFLDAQSGRRAWHCELSSVDTALFIAGALTAAEFFDRDDPVEAEIRSLAKMLYERIDWAWMLAGGDTLCHGWKPESGFLPHRWEGYDEALILYFLALGSPTHPIGTSSYAAWLRTYEWKEIYGIEYLYAGSLFIHQMSHLWVDFRGIRDRFMREHDCDYFENSRRATLIQQEYAIRNPLGFDHYGELSWGVTASDGPGDHSLKLGGVQRTFYDYIARGVPYGPDDGTLAPWAVVASLPFAPEIVLPTVRAYAQLHLRTADRYGFKASFNPAFGKSEDRPHGWVSPFHFGINEGPTVLMIENHRSGMVWSLMRKSAPLVAGLRAAGFSGGWLA